MVPERDNPLLFTNGGKLDTFGAIETYFSVVRQLFPDVFKTDARVFFYEFEDPTKVLNGLYDAATGAHLDKGQEWEYGWMFEQYCNATVGKKGYRLAPNADLCRFLRAYWGFKNFMSERGLAAMNLETLGYFAMTMGASLQSLAALKGKQHGLPIEEWVP